VEPTKQPPFIPLNSNDVELDAASLYGFSVDEPLTIFVPLIVIKKVPGVPADPIKQMPLVIILFAGIFGGLGVVVEVIIYKT
jgi:hypothetical protein